MLQCTFVASSNEVNLTERGDMVMLTAAKAFVLATALLCLGVSGCVIDKTPPFDHVRTSPKLQAFSSCDSLAAALKENLKQEMRVQLEQMQDIRYYSPEEGDGAVPTSDGGNRQEGVDYSGTNVQEQGVDEGDFVKTDGYALYVLNGTALYVVPVPEFGELGEAASVKIEGWPTQLLIYKKTSGSRASRAVVFSTVYAYLLPNDHPLLPALMSGRTSGEGADYSTSSTELTKITVIDLDTMAAPRVVRQLYFEGYYQTSRKIESMVRMVSYSWMNIPGLRYWPELPDDYYTTDNQTKRDRQWKQAVQATIAKNNVLIDSLSLNDLVPRMYEVTTDGDILIHDFTVNNCTAFTIAQDGLSHGFTSLLSFDLADDLSSIDGDHIISNWSVIYASATSLLIAEPAQDWWWYWNNEKYDEATNIHRFALEPDGTAYYTGSGRVDGTVENQFCLSEYSGAVRVAATTGRWNRWWEQNPEPPETHVFVLKPGDNATLELVGKVDGIAKGEHLWAARFVGEKGYLVTFRNTDPLWTVDVTDPAHPMIIGELQVPGVATYIHPLSDARLLTIGYGGDEERLDGSIQVSLFDVVDFANPKLIDTLTLFAAENDNQTAAWGWSEALYEHKAFQYWSQKKMLAVPLSASRYTYKDGYNTYEYISKLQLIAVDNNTGFAESGSIDHSSFYNTSDGDSYYWCNQDIRRSVFMGDFIYALSDRGITAHALESLALTASVKLPGTDCGGMIYATRRGMHGKKTFSKIKKPFHG